MAPASIPTTREEMKKRGWSSPDVLLVTGDAYVDHPSFGVAVIARVLEAAGFRVAVLSQPDYHSAEEFKKFGKPSLFFGVSAGNMDSMVCKYTALGKVRNNDAYSESGTPFLRPDRATIVYAQRAREAFRDVPVVLGGVEASLRRLAHYDYWDNRIRRSILLDAKADLLVYGMGESQVLDVAGRLAAGESMDRIRDVRGTLFALSERESADLKGSSGGLSPLLLPSFEEVRESPGRYNEATRLVYASAHPLRARTLIQLHGKRAVIQLPPALPLGTGALDGIYRLPFSRRPHERYRSPIPAFEMIRDSVTITRGCFGGCSFCSIALHQGPVIQSRSERSVLEEVVNIAGEGDFRGTISDLGGPTANTYRMGPLDDRICRRCERLSCLYPRICSNLNTDHGPLIRLLEDARSPENVSRVLVASGIRMDLALREPAYIRAVASHHTGGHMKVAPEHVAEEVLRCMRKPPREVFERFEQIFTSSSEAACREQYLLPYLISSHPGTDLNAAIELARYLKAKELRPRQIQDFLPSPMSLATAMYHTGHDPIDGRKVRVPTAEREKRLFRALTLYHASASEKIIAGALKRMNASQREKAESLVSRVTMGRRER
jgi:uncharacterized radical SAM protein YgiQ